MSVIQTIRNKYGKIAGGVIAVALVGFIVSDASNGSWGSLFSGRESHVMSINGTKIDPKDYQIRVKEYELLYTMFNKGRTLDEAERAQMNEQVVQNIVFETMVEAQCDKLGIITTKEEIEDLIYGPNAHRMVQQFSIEGQQIFVNRETNAFEPQIIKQLEKELAEQAQKIDPTGKVSDQWNAVKSYVKRTNRIEKFSSLFGGATFLPTFLAKHSMADQNSMAAIRFVKVPFTAVADNEIKVTDEDLKDYMKRHSGQYTTDQPTRAIEYVSFDIVPSSADTQRAIAALEEAKTDLANAKDHKSIVNSRSDETNSFTEAFLNKRTFLSRYSDTLMTTPVGSIYGPYIEDGNYKITKVIERKTLPDSVKWRYMVVRTKDKTTDVLSDSDAVKRIDSAIAAVKAGRAFDTVAAQFSDDKGQGAKENYMTLIQAPELPKELVAFLLEGSVKEMKMVKVANDAFSGYFYAEIMEKNGIAPAIQIATITKNLAPSDSTVNAIYGLANEFAGKNSTAADFDNTVKKGNMDRRVGDNVKVNSFTITGLGAAREVVRWMYDHKVGDISTVFQLGESRYIIAKLAAVNEKGMVGISSANRPLLEMKVREEKKAELIAKKYASKPLEEIASASAQTVQQADSVLLGGAYIADMGYEPKVVGYAFNNSFALNTVSPGIKGQGGVYFITVLNRNVPTIDQGMMMMMSQARAQQEAQLRNAIGQSFQQALTRRADVEYVADNF